MSNHIHIAGSPARGIVLLSDDGAVRSLGQVGPTPVWLECSQVAGFVRGEAAFACLLGGAHYTTVAHGTAIRYLSSLGQPQARWKDVASPPAGTGIAGLAGGPQEGYLLLGADGRSLYRLAGMADDRSAGSGWKPCAAPPFGDKATLIAGDWQHGMLALGDGAAEKLVNDGTGDTWTALPAPPLAIDMVTGNFEDGFLAYGEGQLCMLSTGPSQVGAACPCPASTYAPCPAIRPMGWRPCWPTPAATAPWSPMPCARGGKRGRWPWRRRRGGAESRRAYSSSPPPSALYRATADLNWSRRASSRVCCAAYDWRCASSSSSRLSRPAS